MKTKYKQELFYDGYQCPFLVTWIEEGKIVSFLDPFSRGVTSSVFVPRVERPRVVTLEEEFDLEEVWGEGEEEVVKQ